MWLEMANRGLIVFRVNAGTRDAPFQRSLILAETHVRRGGKVCFALSAKDSWAADILLARGLPNLPISSPAGSEQDLQQLIAIASRHNAGAVHLSGRGFSKQYMKGLAAVIPTAVDAVRSQAGPVQIVIDPTFSADEYVHEPSEGTVFLLGPAYQVVPPEIADWPRPRPSAVHTVLRCLVMSEDEHLTARLLDCMPRPERTTTLSIATSKSCPILSSAARAACARGYLIETICKSSILDTIAWCDAAIVTLASHSSQLGFYSLPTLSFSASDTNHRCARRLAREQASLYADPLDQLRDSDIEEVIGEFFRDEAGRQQMGRRLGSLVDGQGADRILDKICAVHQPRLRMLEAA